MANLDRRSFLSGVLASLGVMTAAGVEGSQALAQTPAGAAAGRIDVHHHFAPPAWVAEVNGRPLLQAANTAWTPAKSLEDMDRGGVAAALVSITNSGLWFGDAAVTRRLVRACNDYGARLVQDHPRRFGLLAAMPLPDVDATLQEIAYAYDTLHADGIALFTSYGDTWLGAPDFRPVMAELHRRKAVATFIQRPPTAAGISATHPASRPARWNTAPTPRAPSSASPSAAMPRSSRMSASSGRTRAARRRFSPGRIDGGSRNARDRLPNGFMHEARRFHYDLAGATNPGAVASLLQLVSSAHILFGTDFPPGGSSSDVAKALASLTLLHEADRRAIERDNALRLCPRLRR